ncbi:MAG: DUF512 domain-containing protein [Clostridiales bacterium]|jgi:putative radical SAM enzyme (TIGR03279 family)|nr:DUF512 domain-containing protein [Clostridiales bacterium]
MSVLITGVQPNSCAARHGILPGETLVSINGHPILDVLDYRFYEINSSLTLVIEGASGVHRELTLKKREYDGLGLTFETYLMDKQHSCRNKCIFCFIDQMPKGLRETLYFKDDDSRLSFLFGNYITLTNLSEHEISRIIEMHISPMNISVHTTNPKLRVEMMGNRFAGDALEVLNRLAQAGIKINCQLVLCPGINDGPELIRTLSDLEKLHPAVESVAAVPVGVTKFREGLYPLQQYDKETAAQVLDIMGAFGDRCFQKYGSRIAYPADEFFLKAGREIPPTDYYGELAQLENGVGLISLLREEFSYALEDTPSRSLRRKITLATGTAAQPFLSGLFEQACRQFPGLAGEVVAIRNEFFGETITVAGLVTGGDLIQQLKGRDLGDELLVPLCMLRREGDLFLDDVSLQEVTDALHVPVRVVANDGQQLLDAMLGSEN